MSVCIPTYNGERFLAEAISSVLLQTYPAIELIIADDGSTDGTIAIACLFQENAPVNIRLIVQEHQGIADNCNAGISQANGKYIKFVFQDDLLTSDCIEKMVDVAEGDSRIGLVFSRREMVFDDGAENDPNLRMVYENFRDLQRGWSDLKPLQWGRELLADSQLFEHPINKIGEPTTVLLRREVCDRVGGFDPNLNQLVDLDLWWRIFAVAKVGFIDETLSYFRLHDRQKTCQNMREGTDTDLAFFEKVCFADEYQFLSPAHRIRSLLIYTTILNHELRGGEPSKLEASRRLRRVRRSLAEKWLGLSNLKETDLRNLAAIRQILGNGELCDP
ncbi:MAG: glycosyltransferase [Limnospira sp.]